MRNLFVEIRKCFIMSYLLHNVIDKSLCSHMQQPLLELCLLHNQLNLQIAHLVGVAMAQLQSELESYQQVSNILRELMKTGEDLPQKEHDFQQETGILQEESDALASDNQRTTTDNFGHFIISGSRSSHGSKLDDRKASDEPPTSAVLHILLDKMQTKLDTQVKALCIALDDHVSSDKVNKHSVELLSQLNLPQRVARLDTSEDTPLHHVIEIQNTNIGIIESMLKSVPDAAEWLEVRNKDGLTPLELAFEKKLWEPAHALAEHLINTDADHGLLQEYFFKAMREQGGVDFLPHLLDLWKHHFPDLDLNFSADTKGRTPWWYLANCNDISVMVRVLQTLKNHSIDLMQLLTHTERQTRLVEEAADKNRLLFTTIQKVVGWGHNSGTDQDTADGDETDSYFTKVLSPATSCSTLSFFDEPENQVSIQNEPGIPYKVYAASQGRHILPTSDEECKPIDSQEKKRKGRKLVQRSR